MAFSFLTVKSKIQFNNQSYHQYQTDLPNKGIFFILLLYIYNKYDLWIFLNYFTSTIFIEVNSISNAANEAANELASIHDLISWLKGYCYSFSYSLEML